MDDETREEAARMMQALAKGFPRAQRLRLVADRSTELVVSATARHVRGFFVPGHCVVIEDRWESRV
jgi:hypothetical protein